MPDAGIHRHEPTTVYVPTAAMVIEVLSPADETWAKLGFYAARGVDELLVVDTLARTVTLLALADTGYLERPASALLDVTTAGLQAAVTWPPPA